jgi:adenine-specific DNA glycosylase
VVVVQRRDRFLAVKQDVGRVNGGLWEFPSVRNAESGSVPSQIAGVRFRNPQHLGALNHSITRYRITARVYLARASTLIVPGDGAGRWFTRAELERLPMSAAHRRIASRFLGQNGCNGKIGRFGG